MDPVEQAVKQLMTAVKCTVCGTNYDRDNVKVLGHQDELWFLTVTCGNCHTQGLVAALIKDPNKADPATASVVDPSQQDVVALEPEIAEAEPSAAVTSDDVQEMHSFLDEFDGNFQHLFQREG